MKNWLCLVALVIFPTMFAYAEASDVEITVVDSNKDSINSWGLYIEIFLDSDRKTPILKIEEPKNPSHVSLEKGKYVINVYRHDMLVGYYHLNLDGLDKNIQIPIYDLGGTRFTVYYNDNKPIQGAKVEIFSYKGTKWAEDITGSDGKTERFWLQIPDRISDYYSAKISLGEEISYELPKFRFGQGLNNEVVITPWKSIVDDLVKIQLYKNMKDPVSAYDGKFSVELYNNDNEKLAELKVDNHGKTEFSNVHTGVYFLRVLEHTDSGSEVITTKEVLIYKNMGEIKIFGLKDTSTDYKSDNIKPNPEIESPEETCNCVAFRLDNVQDYYLVDVQKELIELFLSKDAPITLGIIGKNFGSDAELIDFLKTTTSEHGQLIGIGNHGGTTDITTMSKDAQSELIRNTDNNIIDFIGTKPSVFIPPYGSYNADTISVLENEGVHYVSSVASFDVAPYPLKDESVFRFPSTASTGYIEQGRAWYGISAKQTMSDIKFSVRDYGFAVVLLHPHEYSKRSGWVFENQLDIPQYHELDKLIDEVKNYGLKIVLIDNIDREVVLAQSPFIPHWFKATVSWWLEGKTTNSDFFQSMGYLVEQKIIPVQQIDSDIKFSGRNIPTAFTNNAKLWVQDKISEKEFLNEIEILAKQGVIQTFR
ncbi:MAG: polysaccharide deacetylase family protein [Nitrosopumilus sp.]|nr:polysaccharide deacetylase family protein [Nitrosopumilus sp.]